MRAAELGAEVRAALLELLEERDAEGLDALLVALVFAGTEAELLEAELLELRAGLEPATAAWWDEPCDRC